MRDFQVEIGLMPLSSNMFDPSNPNDMHMWLPARLQIVDGEKVQCTNSGRYEWKLPEGEGEGSDCMSEVQNGTLIHSILFSALRLVYLLCIAMYACVPCE